MKKQKDVILYRYKGKAGLYINLTNRCTNQCQFCIRYLPLNNEASLWLKKEPTAKEIIKKLQNHLKSGEFSEVVFCGFGEPLVEVEKVREICQYLKENYPLIKIRVNTNGLANLCHQRNVVSELRGLVDSISISLNAHSSKIYNELCRPIFGEKAFRAILEFIKECRKVIPDVRTTVVRWPTVDIEKCEEISKKLKVKFFVREFRNHGSYYEIID